MATASNTVRVGFVGVSGSDDPTLTGWANVTHLPALEALDGVVLAGVCATSPEKAQAAADRFGVPGYSSAADMAAAQGIDIVAVTVKVPDHYDVVTAAIEAGKPVYCEWPLGNGLLEAEKMTHHAATRDLRCAVGLQARAAPTIRYVRDLVAQGYIGDVLSTTLLGSGMNWGPGMLLRNAYTLDARNGATLLTIGVGHALDPLEFCLGRIEEVQTLSGLRREEIHFVENSKTVKATAEDQWVIAARLESGAVASIHYRGGQAGGQNLRWEINGTEGDLVLSSDFGQMQPMTLALAGAKGGERPEPMEIPPEYMLAGDLPDPALNVAQAWALFVSGSEDAATFEDALHMHRLIDAIDQSARTGRALVREFDKGVEVWCEAP
ncbi:oxidoreductase [Novosphingobium marinum]|uniref:Putative dehydrogenase n=1 Tax=Novosphingobium marinum TaxID=1514948 RepID=A0A7Z0BU32_9SPHN|nr:Gfo/Idh/MocA family oxidoreductase [Novosphingobium marinum]NYH94743.1 putative dehydrogenase [Novosphingobium marinum]GGC37642.1 oxidoreductase [Novosphingobium marinum]